MSTENQEHRHVPTGNGLKGKARQKAKTGAAGIPTASSL